MSQNSSKVYNVDELESPQWLNKDFFAKVLRRIEQNDQIEIRTLNLKPATVENDHFASIMFRATINFESNNERKTTTLIVKAFPELEGYKKDMLSESYIFETEIGMYTEVVPKFKEILKVSGEQKITLGPNCLYHSLSPKKVIIFEDLLPLGYEVQRKQELSLVEVKAACEKLAKWHAVSHKILTEQPEFFATYRHGIINTKCFSKSVVRQNGTNYFIEMLAEHEDLLPYKPYFEALNKKNLMKSAIESCNEYQYNPQENAFYVLCHGDFQYKNLMFKREPKTRQLLDLMLLDFQLCYVGPAIHDLIYSFFLLLSAEQRLQHFDELCFYYFEKLQETLKKIGFTGQMPKMRDLRYQLMCHKDLELFLFTTFSPVWHSFQDEELSKKDVINPGDRFRLFYKNPKYLAEVRALLPKYLHMGYLES